MINAQDIAQAVADRVALEFGHAQLNRIHAQVLAEAQAKMIDNLADQLTEQAKTEPAPDAPAEPSQAE